MSKKLTIEFVKQQFEREGYELLSKEYINSKVKLKYICPMRHKHSISWSNWRTGYRCPTCGHIRANKLRGINFDFVKSQVEKEGYKLLSKEYKGPHRKLNYICPNGHKCSTRWSKWYYADQKCLYCSKRPPISFEGIKKSFEEEGYILLSDRYINGKKLRYICNNGHFGSITWDNWKYNNRRCKKCSNNVSKFELEVKNFLDYICVEYVSNDRNQIANPNTRYNLELDIWLPNLRKAIECNGKYWHSKQDKIKLDCLKKDLCYKNNIDLLTITDIEWKNNIDESKQKIINFLGVKDEEKVTHMSC